MKAHQFPIDVVVRDVGGAYVTMTVLGQRVSCTHSSELAVERLCSKLCQLLGMPAGQLRASLVKRLPMQGGTRWRITQKAAR